MRKVQAGNLSSQTGIAKTVRDLCDASQQVTEEIADAYTVTVPVGFVPVRAFDLTQAVTPDNLGAVLATFLLDMKQRGVARRTSSV